MAVLSHEGTYPILYGSLPIPIGAGHVTGYISRPDEAGRVPVVLVLPGIGDMGSLEKDLCRRLARSGFAGVSVPLYPRRGDTLDRYDTGSDESVLARIDEVQRFIASDDVAWNIDDRLGIFATDVGGRFGIVKAATRDWVGSLVVCYTPFAGDEEREHQVGEYLDHLPVPVLGLYGQDDGLIDASSVDEAQRRNEHGQWLLYQGAGHGFLDIDGDGYDPAAAEDAWARVLAFFAATLPAPQIEELG